MKKALWTTVGGFLVGAVVGAALLFVNPLTASRARKANDLDVVLRYSLPSDTLAVTHGGRHPLPRTDGVDELWEATLRNTSLAALVLSGDNGAVLASRISVPSRRTELLIGGLLIDDYWLLTAPGDGSFYIVGESNVWPIAKDTLLSVSLLGRSFDGPRIYEPTAGPGVRAARVLGGTLRLADRDGRALERYRVKNYDRERGFEDVGVELHVSLDAPTPVGHIE
jgi:hypothetical protein